MRYFDGKPPEVMEFGKAWQSAHFELIDKTTEVAPGVWLIAVVSDVPGTLELKELSLAINTPDEIVLIVGCSHPGIEKIVEAASVINPKIHYVIGGFHLVVAPDDVVAKVTSALRDRWSIEIIAPGHCTGEPTFEALRRAFGGALCLRWSRNCSAGRDHRAPWLTAREIDFCRDYSSTRSSCGTSGRRP